MGQSGIKLAIGAFFVWLSSQMGAFAEEVLGRVRESVQASELLTVDGYIAVWSIEQRRTRAPADQAEFERAARAELSARGRDVTTDRWGQTYVYELLGQRPVAWRITSRGPDRRLGTEDDLVVERHEDTVAINRDPVAIMEQAIERKRALDREAMARLRVLVSQLQGGSGGPPGLDRAPGLDTAQDRAQGDPQGTPGGPNADREVSPEELRQLREALDASLADLDMLLQRQP